MFYIVDTNKSFEEVSADLEAEVTNNGFGVLHVHNLGETLRSKGVDFKEDCKVFEICNPIQANNILSIDMKLNAALPCRVSVYTEKDTVRISMINPSEMFATLTDDKEVFDITKKIEDIIVNIINNSK